MYLRLMLGMFLVACGEPRRPPIVGGFVVLPPECHAWVPLPAQIDFAEGSAELDDADRASARAAVRTWNERRHLHQVRVLGHSDACGPESEIAGLAYLRASRVAAVLAEEGLRRVAVLSDGPWTASECAVPAPHRGVELTALECVEARGEANILRAPIAPPRDPSAPCEGEWTRVRSFRFEHDEVVLDEADATVLTDLVAQVHQSGDPRVRVYGWRERCDASPEDEAIARVRAVAIASALVERGIAREQIEALITVPSSDGDPCASQAEDRRADVDVLGCH